MLIETLLADLFNRMGQPLRVKQAKHLAARIRAEKSIIVLTNGKVYADTRKMRMLECGNGYVVTETEFFEIPMPVRKAKARPAKKKAPRFFIRIESQKQMFAICKGERSRKKPGSGGRFVPNAPLRGMALSRLEIERNRPDFIDYVKYIYDK